MTSPSTGTLPQVCFIIPVVHPQSPLVKDYQAVEDFMKMTLQSVVRQRHIDARAIVVCHQLPTWSRDFSDHVSFLFIPPHEHFGPTPADRTLQIEKIIALDKGRKYLFGILFAEMRLSPKFVVPMDADDFVHRDLGAIINKEAERQADKDGFTFLQGYHVEFSGEALEREVATAVIVDRFDLTCGSSRVFRAERIASEIAATVPTLWDRRTEMIRTENANESVLSSAFLDEVATLDAEDDQAPEDYVRRLGVHTNLAVHYRLGELERALAAKGCGHANHAGRRQGSVHWHRVIGLARRDELEDGFGLRMSAERRRPGSAVGRWATFLKNEDVTVVREVLWSVAKHRLRAVARTILRRRGSRTTRRARAAGV